MDKKEFSSLYVGQLKISHLYALGKSTIDMASPVEGIMEPLMTAIFTQLKTVNADLEHRLKRALGSLTTPELTQLDHQRDGIFDEIKREVKVAAKSSNADKKNAGKKLEFFLNPYWDTPKQALNTETDLIMELIKRYHADPTLNESAATLGISPLWDELDAANSEFARLYYERNAEISAKEEPAIQLKQDSVDSYRDFADQVQKTVNYLPSDEFNALFEQMNTMRKTYQALIPKGKKDDEQKDNEQKDDKG